MEVDAAADNADDEPDGMLLFKFEPEEGPTITPVEILIEQVGLLLTEAIEKEDAEEDGFVD